MFLSTASLTHIAELSYFAVLVYITLHSVFSIHTFDATKHRLVETWCRTLGSFILMRVHCGLKEISVDVATFETLEMSVLETCCIHSDFGDDALYVFWNLHFGLRHQLPLLRPCVPNPHLRPGCTPSFWQLMADSLPGFSGFLVPLALCFWYAGFLG